MGVAHYLKAIGGIKSYWVKNLHLSLGLSIKGTYGFENCTEGLLEMD